MGKGRRSGVSYEELPNGTYRVRWRETEQRTDGTSRRVQKSKTVSTEATAKVVQAEVLLALERGEVPNFEPVRVVEVYTTVDAVLAGWVRSRLAKGIAKNTHNSYVDTVGRILRTLRLLHKIPDDQAVPGELLTRDNILSATVALRPKHSEGVVYTTIRVLVSAWAWAGDDPEEYPLPHRAPRDTSELLPRPAIYLAGPAPTLAECDAVLRRLAALRHTTLALPASIIARSTGLRVSQVLGIRVEDIDFKDRVLLVRVGKSRREKAMQREIPIAPVLLPSLVELVAGRTEGPLIRRRSDQGGGRGSQKAVPSETLRNAWEAATLAGETRREVWAPPGRKITRPDHAFRAAFQAFLEGENVRGEVIDQLVGHAGGGLRRQHYVDDEPIWPAMQAAVALIPEVDWTGPGAASEAPDNVVPLRRA